MHWTVRDQTPWDFTLDVHRVERGGPEDEEGVVEFTARSLDGRHVVELHERSTFRRKGGRWLYVDGECEVTRSPAGPQRRGR